MERLRAKGYLVRRKKGGVYRYSPKRSQADVLRNLVADFVRQALGGSVSPFVAYLAEDADLDDEQVHELAAVGRRSGSARAGGRRWDRRSRRSMNWLRPGPARC